MTRRGRQVGQVEGDVAGDEQIEQAVAVVVAERAPRGPAVDSDPRGPGDVIETTAVDVAVEAIAAEVGDVEVLEPVVVDVAHTDALAPALVGDARARRDVSEGAGAVVAEEGGRWSHRALPHEV